MGNALADFWRIHQTTFLFTLLTFGLGTVAGFQGIVARIPSEWRMALKTLSGISYIVARGSLPAILYLALHKARLLTLTNPFYEALILGGGSETFLRSRVLLVFKSAAPGEAPAEETKGPLDFIFWFQQFFVDRAGQVLATQRNKVVARYYDKAGLKLEELVQSVDANAGAVLTQAAAARKAADSTLHDYLKAKDKATAPFDARTEHNWCRKLGFTFYEVLTIDNYHALSEQITR